MKRAIKASIAVVSAALVGGVVWVALPAGATTIAAGTSIRVESSGKCLNVAGASTADNAKVIQFTCTPAATNDKWTVVPKGNGTYWIQNVKSAKCLTVAGASKNRGASLIQYACTIGGNETWTIESQVQRSTVRIRSTATGMCVNVPGASTANSVNLIQYTCQPDDGTANERISLPPATSAQLENLPITSMKAVSAVQAAKPAGGGTAPVTYSWINDDATWETLTDFNPDRIDPDPNAPAPSISIIEAWPGYTGPRYGGTGYTGYPVSALLANKRVEIVAHEAATGDVHVRDENTAGTGGYGGPYDLGGTTDGQPTLAVYAPGRLALYEIAGGALWVDPEATNNPQAPIGGWRNLGGTALTGAPSVVANGSGARIFAADTRGGVMTATLTGTTLSGWTDLGGSNFGDPEALAQPGNRVLVVANEYDTSVEYKEMAANGTWSAAWTSITGAHPTGKTSAALTPDGRAVLVMQASHAIFMTTETAVGSGTFPWLGQFEATNVVTATLSDPTVFPVDLPSGKSLGIVYRPEALDNSPVAYMTDPSWWKASTTAGAAKTTNPSGHLEQLTTKR